MKIEKWMKLAGICLIAAALVFAVAASVRTAIRREVIVEEKELLTYEYQSNASYSVKLRANDYFEQTTREMDETYIYNLIDHINIKLGAAYEGDAKAQAEGAYEIAVVLRGYELQEGEKVILWEKTLELLEEDTIEEQLQSYEISQQVSLRLEDYALLGQAAMQELGITCSCELAVVLQGALDLEKDEERASIPLEAYVAIPISDGMITIGRSADEYIADSIRTQVESVGSLEVKKLVLQIMGAVLLAVFLVLWCGMTRLPDEQERKKRRLEGIIKSNRSRLIELQELPMMQWQEVYEVTGIAELWKLSDELRRPVFYIRDEKEIVRASSFFVSEGECQYLYVEK